MFDDFVAEFLIGLPRDKAGRIRPAGAALDQGPAFARANFTSNRDRRCAQRRRQRMFARPGLERCLEGAFVDSYSGKRVGLSGQGGGKNAQVSMLAEGWGGCVQFGR